MLEKDPDLESIRQSEDFARIQAESTRRWKEAFRPEPDIVVHTPETSPPHVLLIALHGMGSGEEAGTFANHWSAALDTGAVVAVPQSSQPHSPDGGWTWADESQTDADLRFVYDRITSEHDIDPRRVVLAGFSQGGRVAISAALRQHPIPACGFIAVAPAIRDHPIDRDLTGPSLRARIIVGEQDWVLDSVQTLYATAIDQGQQWSLETVRDLGHDFPPDFTDRLMSALTFTIDYSA
jgi:predicted esterase